MLALCFEDMKCYKICYLLFPGRIATSLISFSPCHVTFLGSWFLHKPLCSCLSPAHAHLLCEAESAQSQEAFLRVHTSAAKVLQKLSFINNSFMCSTAFAKLVCHLLCPFLQRSCWYCENKGMRGLALQLNGFYSTA